MTIENGTAIVLTYVFVSTVRVIGAGAFILLVSQQALFLGHTLQAFGLLLRLVG